MAERPDWQQEEEAEHQTFVDQRGAEEANRQQTGWLRGDDAYGHNDGRPGLDPDVPHGESSPVGALASILAILLLVIGAYFFRSCGRAYLERTGQASPPAAMVIQPSD